jgi:hypothetical protein
MKIFACCAAAATCAHPRRLGGNDISDAGASELARALALNTRLTEL